MTVLGIDYGDRRVGMAMSDELGIAAHGLPTAEIASLKDAVAAVLAVVEERRPDRVVVGMPLGLDGTPGERARTTHEFCRKCRRALRNRGSEVPIETLDERLTSVRAERTLHEAGIPARDQRAHIDRVSAVIIVQDYLAAHAEALP